MSKTGKESVLRCFIAWQFDAESLGRLDALQTALQYLVSGKSKLDPEGNYLRYVKPTNFHITALFLGDLFPEQVHAAAEALTEARRSWEFPIRLPVSRITGFPSGKKARVIVLSLDDPGALLEEQHRQLSLDFARRGLPFDAKALRPHVSLAYVRKQAPRGFQAAIAGDSELPLLHTRHGRFSLGIRAVELISSRLQSGGSDYRIIC